MEQYFDYILTATKESDITNNVALETLREIVISPDTPSPVLEKIFMQLTSRKCEFLHLLILQNENISQNFLVQRIFGFTAKHFLALLTNNKINDILANETVLAEISKRMSYNSDFVFDMISSENITDYAKEQLTSSISELLFFYDGCFFNFIESDSYRKYIKPKSIKIKISKNLPINDIIIAPDAEAVEDIIEIFLQNSPEAFIICPDFIIKKNAKLITNSKYFANISLLIKNKILKRISSRVSIA